MCAISGGFLKYASVHAFLVATHNSLCCVKMFVCEGSILGIKTDFSQHRLLAHFVRLTTYIATYIAYIIQLFSVVLQLLPCLVSVTQFGFIWNQCTILFFPLWLYIYV